MTPMTEAAAVLDRVAHQDLRARVQGTYAGDHAAIKTSINTMVEDLRGSIQTIGGNAQALSASSEQLTAVSQQMAANAEETATQPNVVSAAAEQVSKNLTVVATGSEEMVALDPRDRQERQRGGAGGEERRGRGRHDQRDGAEARRELASRSARSSR